MSRAISRNHIHHAGYCRTYIVLPSSIYSLASNPLVDAGIQNPHSVAIPWLIKASLDRGRAGVVGKGAALWPNVHIDDSQFALPLSIDLHLTAVVSAADLYIVLYDTIVKNGPDNVDHGIRGYYFGENGEYSWYDISKEIGRTMIELKLTNNPEPTTFSDEELVKYFGSVVCPHLLSSFDMCG
jgi:hypothetical protein